MPPSPGRLSWAGFELLLVVLCQLCSAAPDFHFTNYISIEYRFLLIPHTLHCIEMLTFLVVLVN